MRADDLDPAMNKSKTLLPEIGRQEKILKSIELFAGCREILIEHNREYYRLMITKAGKLILNK